MHHHPSPFVRHSLSGAHQVPQQKTINRERIRHALGALRIIQISVQILHSNQFSGGINRHLYSHFSAVCLGFQSNCFKLQVYLLVCISIFYFQYALQYEMHFLIRGALATRVNDYLPNKLASRQLKPITIIKIGMSLCRFHVLQKNCLHTAYLFVEQ